MGKFMICENCKNQNASLIFLVDSFTEKKIKPHKKYVWTKYLCSECYIFLNWGSDEYDRFQESLK